MNAAREPDVEASKMKALFEHRDAFALTRTQLRNHAATKWAP